MPVAALVDVLAKSTAYQAGYVVGRILIFVLIAALIIWLVRKLRT